MKRVEKIIKCTSRDRKKTIEDCQKRKQKFNLPSAVGRSGCLVGDGDSLVVTVDVWLRGGSGEGPRMLLGILCKITKPVRHWTPLTIYQHFLVSKLDNILHKIYENYYHVKKR